MQSNPTIYTKDRRLVFLFLSDKCKGRIVIPFDSHHCPLLPPPPDSRCQIHHQLFTDNSSSRLSTPISISSRFAASGGIFDLYGVCR
ncbi:hypothetical protein SLA2020_500630 [Shorea laevis]